MIETANKTTAQPETQACQHINAVTTRNPGSVDDVAAQGRLVEIVLMICPDCNQRHEHWEHLSTSLY